MTYRSLTVLLDDDPSCPARTELAIRIAKGFDCHLVGLAPTGLIDIPLRAEATGSLPEYAARAWADLEERAQQGALRFAAACSDVGFKSFESVVDRCETSKSLLRHAQCSDFLVLSQADPRRSDHRAMRDMVERVVLISPRPTLVLPYTGGFEAVGSRVMVAWDDSREAARALSDAMPLLLCAKRVDIEAWNETPDDGATDALRRRLDELHRWLMWHGVSAHLRLETTTIGIAAAMLSRAADLGSDLIVMGAYGHARWAERVLGGATRGLLESMTVPVLMSH
jgi:nucleotide-binding universal stress UspA family protein